MGHNIEVKTYQMYTEPCMQTGEFFKNKKQSQVKSYIKRKLESKEDCGCLLKIVLNMDSATTWSAKRIRNNRQIVKNASRICNYNKPYFDDLEKQRREIFDAIQSGFRRMPSTVPA